MSILKYLTEQLSSNKTIKMWHGGNLEDYSDIIAQKNGRYEYGAGLYLTTSYNVVQKYKKGSRKLYLITVSEGNDLNSSYIDYDVCIDFVNNYVIKNKRQDIIDAIDRRRKPEGVPASVMNVSIMNNKAIKSTNTTALRQFFIDNGVDYEIVKNAFGWGEWMMVLYNMNKIIDKQIITSKDKIDDYDLPTEFR